MPRLRSRIAAGLLAWTALVAPAAGDVSDLYREHCAACHGDARLGGSGPALIPESLGRLDEKAIAAVIAKGRTATKMPGFSDALAAEDVAALAAFLKTPLDIPPVWGEAEIAASHAVLDPAPPAEKPVFTADPKNLFVVVEAGDHHVSILDGGTFEPIARFETHVALHGGPKFSPDGRFVYFMSRDGWVTKYDLWGLKPVAEVRAAINSRNIALSADGKHIAVAAYLPRILVILNADTLAVEKLFEVKDKKGNPSRVSAVYQAPQRNSFIAALKDVPEIWEVSTDPNAPPQFEGLVHSYEKGMVEGLASSSGLLSLRRIETPEPLDDFFFDPDYRNLIGASREGDHAWVVNLNVGREIARIELPGMPHLGSGTTWDWNGRPVMATPHLKDAAISIIDMTDWKVIRTLKTDGPGFFLRSHDNTPYVWADVSGGKAKDRLHILDKRTLEIVRTITPAPGRPATHVEFDRDGRHALVSIADMPGDLLVLDAVTFAEVKRLPMSKPSGKYNVWNKITFSRGTSH
jgi:mono/diheme cytochrome c family protein/DNA-binding beta-propeller fold protein YncE